MSDVNIQAILTNIKSVSMSPSSIATLCEFERVIDENGLYAFHHWKQGELVEGPIISAYRIKCTFYWPLEKMPDPAGVRRLLAYGVNISYRKAWMKYPIKVKSENDFRGAIKKPKIAKTQVWLVTIDMPKYLIKDIQQSSEEILDQQLNTQDIPDHVEQQLDQNDNNSNAKESGF